MTLGCGDACWGDGPYPDLTDEGDIVLFFDASGEPVFGGGGMIAVLNSYVLTDPAPLDFSNVMVPDKPGRFKKAPVTRSRSVDLEIKVSGWSDSAVYPIPTPPMISDPVAQLEANIEFLKDITIRHPKNLAGVTFIRVVRKSGNELNGYVQFDDFGAAPGRNSRLVTIRTTITSGTLLEA